jgi:hypothetical protein
VVVPAKAGTRSRTFAVQLVRSALIPFSNQAQVHRPARPRLLVSKAMKMTYDPPPPPRGWLGRTLEALAATVFARLAVLLPRSR